MSTAPAPVLLAWSGGKDCTFALANLLAAREWSVAGLLTTVTSEYQRISMHGVRVELLRAQARALTQPLAIVEIPPDASNDVYGERMRAALLDARRREIQTVAFGDLFLEDVRTYREAMLATVEMDALFPLWSSPTTRLSQDFIRAGYRAIITCVDTDQIPAEFAGRDYDDRFLADLPASADPCGENGEFHTFVYDGPLFSSPVPVRRGRQILRDGRFMYQDLLSAGQESAL